MPAWLDDTFDNLFYPPHRNGRADYRYFSEDNRNAVPFDPGGPHALHAWWLADAALLAYESEGTVRQTLAAVGIHDVQLLGAWADPKGPVDRLKRLLRFETTQGFVASTGSFALVVFRGTEKDSVRDLLADVLAWKWWDGGCKVHFGFRWALDTVWRTLIRLLAPHQQKPIFLAGHSLGASLATLAVSRLEGFSQLSLYAYGSPRVGDQAFCEKVSRKAPGRAFRFVNSHDAVTLLPPRRWAYAHVKEERYIDSRGRINEVTDPVEQWRDALHAAVDHDLDLPAVRRLVEEDKFKTLLRSLRNQMLKRRAAGSDKPPYLLGNHSPGRYPYLIYTHHARPAEPAMADTGP